MNLGADQWYKAYDSSDTKITQIIIPLLALHSYTLLVNIPDKFFNICSSSKGPSSSKGIPAPVWNHHQLVTKQLQMSVNTTIQDPFKF